MLQFRFVVLAGVGVLTLFGILLVGSLVDYVAHPETANAHRRVSVTPVAEPSEQAAPLPTTAVTFGPAPPSSAPQGPQPVTSADQGRLAKFLQELQQRRHRPPRGDP